MGTNKIHLYQFLIARAQGKKIDFEDFEKVKDPETLPLAVQVFDRYQAIMLEYYRKQCKEVPGAADTFRWCHAHSIKVATDTGFHRVITDAIMEGLGWVRSNRGRRFYAFSQTSLGKRGSPDGEQLHTNASM